jgi:hypothetical protein
MDLKGVSMPTKKSSSDEDSTPRTKRRKHGYRGYPNSRSGGDVHTGSGFGGAGSLSGSGGGGISDKGIITERTREAVEKTEEEEKEE